MTTNNVINTTFPWGRGAGGTDSTTCDNILQQVTSSITFTTSTATIPFDNTIPQKTEGTEVGTCTITPVSASSILEVYALCSMNCIGAAQVYTLALFRDSGSDALVASYSIGGIANFGFTMSLVGRVASGSTSATTFKLRIGGNSGTTITVNGYNGSALFNGTADTPIIVTEIET